MHYVQAWHMLLLFCLSITLKSFQNSWAHLFCTLCSTFNMEWNLALREKTLSKFAISLPCLDMAVILQFRQGFHVAMSSFKKHLKAHYFTCPWHHTIPLATARASDSALAVDYAHAISAYCIALLYNTVLALTTYCPLQCHALSHLCSVSLWSPYGIGQTIIFSSCGFFFFSSPILSRRGCLPYRYFHTWCGLSANLGCRSETCWKHRTQKSHQKSSSWHHRTTLLGYIFATKAHIGNRKKKLLSSNMSSRCLHNVVNFGPLAAEIGLPVWGTPPDFNGFRVLAALLHGSEVVSVSQTLRHWTEGAIYVRLGDHHIGYWPTF